MRCAVPSSKVGWGDVDTVTLVAAGFTAVAAAAWARPTAAWSGQRGPGKAVATRSVIGASRIAAGKACPPWRTAQFACSHPASGDVVSAVISTLRKSRRPPFLTGEWNSPHGARMWPADGGRAEACLAPFGYFRRLGAIADDSRPTAPQRSLAGSGHRRDADRPPLPRIARRRPRSRRFRAPQRQLRGPVSVTKVPSGRSSMGTA